MHTYGNGFGWLLLACMCAYTYAYESPVAQVKPYKYENLMYSSEVWMDFVSSYNKH